MDEENAGGAGTRGDRRLDVLLPPNAQSLAAHDARHGQPADGADRQKQEILAAAEDHGEKYDEKNQRQAAEDLDEAHHQMIGPSADISRNRSIAESHAQA